MQLSLAACSFCASTPPLSSSLPSSLPTLTPSFATAICTDFSLSFQVLRSHCNHRIAAPTYLHLPATYSPLSTALNFA